MIYRIDSKAFAKALVNKADEKDAIAENITAYTFRFNKTTVTVRLIEDDESFIIYMQVETHYLRLLEQYLGYRHDTSCNWIGYTIPVKGTSVDELLSEMERYKSMTDHDDSIYFLLNLKNCESGYFNFSGKEYLYYRIDNKYYRELIVR